jgi:hypothetical protein
MNESSLSRPKYFTLIRVVCALLGCVGLFGTALLFLLSNIPATKAILGKVVLKDIIWLFQSIGLIVASLWIFKLKEVGRIVILVCAAWSLLQTVYDYLRFMREIPFMSLPSLLFITLCFVNVLIFIYFSRSDIKAYVNAKG